MALLTVNRVHMQSRLQAGVLATLILAIGAMALSGCGVRGSLETPPAAKAATDTGNATPGSTPAEQKPHKPFVLDPILR